MHDRVNVSPSLGACCGLLCGQGKRLFVPHRRQASQETIVLVVQGFCRPYKLGWALISNCQNKKGEFRWLHVDAFAIKLIWAFLCGFFWDSPLTPLCFIVFNWWINATNLLILCVCFADLIMHRDCPLDCKVYVGNLGNNGNKTDLERAFGYYGPLRSVWVARNPPGFAFVEFEDPRDATDAVRELDGRQVAILMHLDFVLMRLCACNMCELHFFRRTLCGCRVRVEHSSGEKRSRARGVPPSWSRRPRERDDYRRRSPPARRRWKALDVFCIYVLSVNC